MSDLVQRLRALQPVTDLRHDIAGIGQEAADEIERLEACLREMSTVTASEVLDILRAAQSHRAMYDN